MGENLIRRSYKKGNVEQTGADANCCKQAESETTDESFFSLDQSSEKLYEEVNTKDFT